MPEEKEVFPVLYNTRVESKFLSIYASINKMPIEKAEPHFQAEAFNFQRMLQEKGIDPGSVTPASVAGVFLDIIAEGLTCSAGAKQVYVMVRKMKTGKKDEKGYDEKESRLVYQVSPQGKTFLAQRSGVIEDLTQPIIAYEGDEFWPETDDRGNNIIHFKRGPRKSKKIIGGFLFKIHRNGRREPFWMEEADIERLKRYSEKNNSYFDVKEKKMVSKGANELYFSGPDKQIDTGFLEAKLVSHALKNVRKRPIPSLYRIDDDVEITPEPDYNAPAIPESISIDKADLATETPMHNHHDEPGPDFEAEDSGQDEPF